MAKLHAPPTASSEIPYASILGAVLIIAALAVLVVQSGAIDAVNDSGLLR